MGCPSAGFRLYKNYFLFYSSSQTEQIPQSTLMGCSGGSSVCEYAVITVTSLSD